MPDKEIKERETIVVSQLPQVQTRTASDESGVEYNCLTIEEALGEMLKIVRELNKKM